MELVIKEQLRKTVVKSGNGGAVWVPRAWLGEEVVVILPEPPKQPKQTARQKVMHILEPYLKDISAAFIYGSHSRHEATEQSDIDVMVITRGTTMPIKAKEKNIEITVLDEDKARSAIQKQPAMFWQMFQEADPLFNAPLIEELKKTAPSKEGIKEYLQDTREYLKTNKIFLDLDALDGECVTSYGAIYSLILRLRGIYALCCYLEKKKYSNKEFKRWLQESDITADDVEKLYATYQAERDDQKVKTQIPIAVARKLVKLTKNELDKLRRCI